MVFAIMQITWASDTVIAWFTPDPSVKYTHQRLIRKFGLKADDSCIYLTHLNTSCRISLETGGIEEFLDAGWRECRSYDAVMTIYDILCYQKGDVAPALSGQWCTVGNFIVTGITQADGFARKYAELVDGNLAQFKAACEQMGGEIMPQMAGADLTCRFWATPFFPVLLQFWEGDEDFPPKLMLLWDSNTPSFLHFETTFYLQGDLLERLMHRFKAE